jgi:hypothetical protein
MTQFKTLVNDRTADEIYESVRGLPLIQRLITKGILSAKIPAEFDMNKTVVRGDGHEMTIVAITNTVGQITVDGEIVDSGKNANDFREAVIRELVKLGYSAHMQK